MKLQSTFVLMKPFAILAIFTLFSLEGFAQMPALKDKKLESLTKSEIELSKSISLDSIKSYTNALAADEMEGRGTMQPGGDKAANWLASKFNELGLKPLGDDGTYLQEIKFKQSVFSPETMLQVGDESLQLRKDYGFVPLGFGSRNKKASGDMLFVGYGMELFARNSGLASKISGKVVVVIDGPPTSVKKEDWEKREFGSKILQTFIFSGAKASLLWVMEERMIKLMTTLIISVEGRFLFYPTRVHLRRFRFHQ